METYFSEIIVFIIIVFFIYFTFVLNKFLNGFLYQKQNQTYLNKIEKFSSYLTILEYYMDKSYNIIYGQKIMVYSIEGSRLSDNELNSISKDFVNLTLKFIGPKIQTEFVNFLGNYETLYFIIGQYFFEKYENDSIRDKAIDDLKNSEIDD